MKHTTKVWSLALSLIAGVTLLSMPLEAKEREKVMTGSYAVTEASKISIEFGVGTLSYSTHDGDTVEVTVIATTESKPFGRKGNLADVELEAEQKGERLQLSVAEQDDIHLEWEVSVPRIAQMNVDLGVGEITGDLYATDMDIDLGVGEVKLTVHGKVGDVDTNVGVGDSKITGDIHSENERFMVASSSRAEGSGEARVSVSVGVGEITLKVKD